MNIQVGVVKIPEAASIRGGLAIERLAAALLGDLRDLVGKLLIGVG